MCKHENIKPIIEYDKKGNRVVYSTVCQDCYQEFVISPMLYSEYIKAARR
ncbi:TPA: hypothetical protein PTV74_003176 [Clostridium botulinum]|nr:hypothetical protein [Clostridium botulinum]HDK7206331.1 hypothetical protein [Clostridium botulinum]HDK7210067.1 hypothetical protein [Clostridium botulinum]HDK7265516.1 hypothetical protein [Clostridium botulinum]HDK7269364.1 hypothetical protein [Clostridium botulinum]